MSTASIYRVPLLIVFFDHLSSALAADSLSDFTSPSCPFDLNVMFRSCHFEVFGRVQGVYFRKHTLEEAKRLELVGTVRNTDRGTVVGVMQGSAHRIEAMKVWLRETGSPMSKIERAVFTYERDIESLEFSDFQVIR